MISSFFISTVGDWHRAAKLAFRSYSLTFDYYHLAHYDALCDMLILLQVGHAYLVVIVPASVALFQAIKTGSCVLCIAISFAPIPFLENFFANFLGNEAHMFAQCQHFREGYC